MVVLKLSVQELCLCIPVAYEGLKINSSKTKTTVASRQTTPQPWIQNPALSISRSLISTQKNSAVIR